MESPSRRALTALPPVAGIKRSAESALPSLLPAFEPESSPSLPRPAKRVARASPDENAVPKYSPLKYGNAKSKYPTPVPTSSTGIFSSSPPRLCKTRRPGLQRTASTLSERAPLASVPSIELDVTGEPLLMGRSGKSSHYQMANSKYISRVHVRAAYVPAKSELPNRVEVLCVGSNGVKIQCQGQAWELGQEESFTSECEDIDVMVEVAGARVILRWPSVPRKALTPEDTDSNTDRENTPRRRNYATIYRSPLSSPLRNRGRLQSPISPTPAARNGASILIDTHDSSAAPIQIYEDNEDDKEEPELEGPTQPTQPMSQPLGQKATDTQDDESDFSDRDEENEPLVHSMGPFGANILPRMQSFTTSASPSSKANDKGKVPPRSTVTKGNELQPLNEPKLTDADQSISNHIVNQLAYSRLSSVPLSTLLSNLPADLKKTDKGRKELQIEDLRALIDSTNCIGEVPRAGKDAAGKPLESEYYYVPENDIDAARRASVVDDLRKPGLRNCRKQHKQYYWRKPK